MRLSEEPHGYQKTIINNTGRHVSFSLPMHEKLRPSTVVALERNPSGRRTIIRNDFTSRSVRATQGGAAVTRESRPAMGVTAQPITKRSSKGRIKSSTVAIYASVFALLVAVIAVGYRAPEESAATASTAPVANAQTALTQPAVNDVVATDVAALVADVAGLAVAPNVSELAVSTRIQSEYASASDTSSISKPVIVQLSAASRNITTYQVQEGDTVASVAERFGISEKTLRWSNNLKDSDRLAVGATIDVLPTDGITYTVKNGDTIDKIASRYKADVAVITTYNDLELNGISTGLKIIIPNGELPTTERPGYVAPVNTFIAGYGAGFSGNTWFIKRGTPMYSGNTYAFGNCTAYTFDRRAELGRPIEARWGHAASWATSALNANRALGFQKYVVDRTPRVGAIIQNGGGYGHVAIVEEILPNGDLRLSEMNASVRGGGFNIVSGRTLSAAVAGQYMYIY